MNPIKKLAGQTAIYGLSSIIGRLLNYLLVPIYTRIFLPGEYGVVTEFYAYTSFLIVLLTYGFETAFFRYASQHKDEKDKVFSTAFYSILLTSIVFISFIYYGSSFFASKIGYASHPEYIIYFGWILFFDAITSIVFAKLRAEERPLSFAAIKLSGIGINILLVLFWLVYCPKYLSEGNSILASLYHPGIGIGYIFIANMVASISTFVLLIYFINFKIKINFVIWKKMAKYAAPLLIVGLAGIVNENLDKILLKYLLPFTSSENIYYVGIYGACYKLSILMTLFIQAFRFAGEPFFFQHAEQKDAKELYAEVMDYFVIIGCIIFLLVLFYIDIFKYFIDEKYWSGLHIVPILLLANLFLGIYYNLSIWYKLTDKTKYGAYIALIGAVITLELNYLLIPVYGITGAAWTTLICYASMVIISYLIGKAYYKIHYNVHLIIVYILLACLFYWVGTIINNSYSEILSLIAKTALFLSYLLIVFLIEKYHLSKIRKSSSF